MSIFAIGLLILLGIVLLLVEFFIAPGVTIAGIGGLVCLITAIFLTYTQHGTTIGHWTLFGTIVSLLAFLYFALKSNTWRKVMLPDAVNSKVDYGISDEKIHVGDRGKAITRLNPIGKVQIGDYVVEGKSITGYLSEHTEVEVVKIQTNNILVKPING